MSECVSECVGVCVSECVGEWVWGDAVASDCTNKRPAGCCTLQSIRLTVKNRAGEKMCECRDVLVRKGERSAVLLGPDMHGTVGGCPRSNLFLGDDKVFVQVHCFEQPQHLAVPSMCPHPTATTKARQDASNSGNQHHRLHHLQLRHRCCCCKRSVCVCSNG